MFSSKEVALRACTPHYALMNSEAFGSCRRQNHVHAAYVNAASVIKQFDLRRAENLLLREGVPREVIARVLLTGFPVRATVQSTWAHQFSR